MMPPTRADLLTRLLEIESDPRLRDHAPANVMVNAPLALIQTEMATESATLRFCLALPPQRFPIKETVPCASHRWVQASGQDVCRLCLIPKEP